VYVTRFGYIFGRRNTADWDGRIANDE
jgi:hypothetical protein